MIRAVDVVQIEARQRTHPVLLNNPEPCRTARFCAAGDNVTIGRTSFVFPAAQRLR